MHYCVNVIFMMKFCLNWGGAALLSMLLLCTSCGDADLFDTDKWKVGSLRSRRSSNRRLGAGCFLKSASGVFYSLGFNQSGR